MEEGGLDLGALLANHMFEDACEAPEFNPTIAMIRSAANPDAARMMADGMDARFVAPLAAWMGRSDARARATLVAAFLAGIAITRDMLRLRSFGEDAGATRALAEDVLNRLLGPDEGSGTD